MSEDTKSLLLKRSRKLEPVELPDAPRLFLRKLSHAELRQMVDENANVAEFMVQHCLCLESGDRVFGDDDLDQVRQLDHETLRLLADRALKLSGLGDKSPKDSAGSGETSLPLPRNSADGTSTSS